MERKKYYEYRFLAVIHISSVMGNAYVNALLVGRGEKEKKGIVLAVGVGCRNQRSNTNMAISDVVSKAPHRLKSKVPATYSHFLHSLLSLSNQEP